MLLNLFDDIFAYLAGAPKIAGSIAFSLAVSHYSRTFFSVRLLHFINSIPLFAFSSRNHRNHRALKMETKRRRVNTPKCMTIEVRRLNHLMVYFA